MQLPVYTHPTLTVLIDDRLLIGGSSDNNAVKKTKKSPAVMALR